MQNDVLFQVLDKIELPLLVVDLDLQPQYCNFAFFSLAGLANSEASLNLSSLVPDLTKKHLSQENFNLNLNSNDGNLINLNVQVEELNDHLVLLSFIRTNIKPDSFQLRRLETLGMLAGGVAHDFNNILAGIIGHVSFLKKILPEEGKHKQSIEAIEDGSNKASLMTREILRFSKKKDSAEDEIIELNILIERTIRLLLGCIGPKSNVEFDSHQSKVQISASEVRVSQVLVNLVVNAHDAIQEAGAKDNNIIINLSVCDDQKILDNLNLNSENAYALIEVIDKGIGMDSATLKKAYQPYFSTKSVSNSEFGGTGLGLTTVQNIINALSGAIVIDSKLNQGTKISVYLPVSSDESVCESLEDQSELSKIKHECSVLVVDDEDVVRGVLELNLKELGYDVTLVASSLDAIEIYKNDPQKFQIVILDMLMPELSGQEVFHQMRELNQEQKFLLISGFCSDDIIDELLAEGSCTFLSKPFTVEVLASKLEEVSK